MSIVDVIKDLCGSDNTTLIGLERELGFGRGTIRNWDKSFPSVDKVAKVAEHFKVSLDFLFGKVPFKNFFEEKHSIAVAAMRQILTSGNEGLESMFFETIHSPQVRTLFTERTNLYVRALLERNDGRDLTDIEAFDLLRFSIEKVIWPDNYVGATMVQFRDDDEETPILLDYQTIPRTTIDEAKGVLFYSDKKLGTYFARYMNEGETKDVIEWKTFLHDAGQQHKKDQALKREVIPPALDRRTPPTLIPILGEISAGVPMFAEQNIIGHEFLPKELLHNGSEYFGLKVKGDSMNLSRMYDGDIAIVRKQDTVENGEIAIVLVNGDEATVKKFYRTETTVTLIPNSTNKEHQPRIIDLKDTEVSVLGKVVKVIIRLED